MKFWLFSSINYSVLMLLGMLVKKLWKALVSFTIPLCLHGTVWHVPTRYAWKLVLDIYNKHFGWNHTKIMDTMSRSAHIYTKWLLALSCLSVCLSACLHGITRLQLDGFSWNWYLRIFWKSVEKIQVSLKLDSNKGYFTWRLIYIFDPILLNFS